MIDAQKMGQGERHCQEQEWSPQPDKELLLRELLTRLVAQGELGRPDPIRASLDALKSWLDEAHIPYKQFFNIDIHG